jgi:bisphosphoglycerate-dependent phosphoglycerate mutase
LDFEISYTSVLKLEIHAFWIKDDEMHFSHIPEVHNWSLNEGYLE